MIVSQVFDNANDKVSMYYNNTTQESHKLKDIIFNSVTGNKCYLIMFKNIPSRKSIRRFTKMIKNHLNYVRYSPFRRGRENEVYVKANFYVNEFIADFNDQRKINFYTSNISRYSKYNCYLDGKLMKYYTCLYIFKDRYFETNIVNDSFMSVINTFYDGNRDNILEICDQFYILKFEDLEYIL
jgi:hypothetical protein